MQVTQQEGPEPPTLDEEAADEGDALDEHVADQPVRPVEPVEGLPEVDYHGLFQTLTRRYGAVPPEALQAVLSPALLRIASLNDDKFTIIVDDQTSELLVPGMTGKFVPAEYEQGAAGWREIAKGRIVAVDGNEARGHVYVGSGRRERLTTALQELDAGDVLEVDQYGAAAKVLSSLVEYSLAQKARAAGFKVRRMPEDVAQDVGEYYSYDFEFERDGAKKRVEVKSLWGTNTDYARLIHSKTKGYETSSCKFATQDVFAVSLFLRTGHLDDFAFAVSVSAIESSEFGLPIARKRGGVDLPDYVTQNPLVPDPLARPWFATIDEVWQAHEQLRVR